MTRSYSSIIAECRYKYNLARQMEYDLKPDNYKWILGCYVADTLTSYNQKFVATYVDNQVIRKLFDINVEIDTVNPDRISLYKEIK